MTEAKEEALRRAVRGIVQAALIVPTLLPWSSASAQEEAGNLAQESRVAPWSFVPSAFVKQTFTDNRRLRAQKDGDAITEVGAGASLRANTRLLTGFLDYSLSYVLHATNSDLNRLKNALNAAATTELVDEFFFIDARASVVQRSISALGTQSPDPDRAPDNHSESSTVAVSPHVHGRIGTRINYSGRLTEQVTHNQSASASGVHSTTAVVGLTGGTPDPFGWSADASRHIIDYRAGRSTENDRVRGVLRYAVTYDLVVGAIIGYEANDYRTLEKQGMRTWGAEATWAPSPRTRLSAVAERRFFGNSHAVTFVHRTQRGVWTVSDSRSITTRATGVDEELLRRLDSLSQEELRNLRILFPQAVSGFLASAATLRREQELSVSLLGGANTLTVHGVHSRTTRADLLSNVPDDLSRAGEVSQRGVTADLTHRFNPSASVHVSGRYMRTKAARNFRTTDLKSVEIGWTTQVGVKARLLVGARHTTSDGSRSYDENNVFGLFRVQF